MIEPLPLKEGRFMCDDAGLWIDNQLNYIIDANQRFQELRDMQ